MGMKTTNNTKRIAIKFCEAVEGPLYAVMGEDSELHVFDTVFRVETVDGRTFQHNAHVVRGALRNPEGFMQPNFQYRTKAAKFQERVEARGSIDPSLWTEVHIQPFDLEAELHAEYIRECQERAGYVS